MLTFCDRINCVAGLSILFFGYDQGMMGGVNTAYDYYTRMGFGHQGPDGEPVVTNSLLQGGIVSVYYLGTLVGCLVGGSLGDRYGRIKSIFLGALIAIVGACLQTSAMNHSWMICARLVNGWGTGILNAIVPVWATEIAEHKSRGQFVAIEFTLNSMFASRRSLTMSLTKVCSLRCCHCLLARIWMFLLRRRHFVLHLAFPNRLPDPYAHHPRHRCSHLSRITSLAR